ncbi:hypothetical protein [Sphingomonas jatrophae]|uniref:DUF2157 domain-containing protein n=1 Tax=Sphingomonas jatrophae TaxID=1166337 RepID=A0A1I6JKM9_9SPHN|nr:hypothetical protein [Sphingomonas jatrophae]SFR79479.1 hypothetical protein SAMN05192580_0402 [Sphingomonas jatrophae]
MYSDADLDSAVAAGVLSPAAAAAFRAHAVARAMPAAVDEEQFRFLTGFNDIFVSIAATLMLGALAWLVGSVAGPFAGLPVAVAAWGLAEYFTLQRRMALPSILLLLAFAGGVFLTVYGLTPKWGGRSEEARAAAVALAITAAAVWAHWRRFHVPITVAAGVAALVAMTLSLLLSTVPEARAAIIPLLLVCGLAAFAVAMWWDMSDRTRTTRRSDIAFWLHLLAAPLIVHPIFSLLGLLGGRATPGEAVAVLLLYVGLGIVALAIDRRALMVSALAYVIYAMSTLFREFGAVSLNLAFTALIIGSALLLLSAFWHSVRSKVLAALPRELRERLPVVDRPAKA